MSSAAQDDELPAPASGLFLEVSFRRLLASCEGVVNGGGGAVDGGSASTTPSMIRPELARNWATSPVFHHYVETLQEQLADLEGAAPAKRPSAQVLAAYKRRADALSARLRPPAAPPSYVSALAGQQGKGGGGGGGGLAAAAYSKKPENENDEIIDDEDEDEEETRHEARRAELLGASASSSSAAAAHGPAVPPAMRPAAPPASLKGLAPRTAEEVETQRGLQETLTDDLVGLARQLRANAEAAGQAVAEREKLLRVAEGALDGAVEGAKRSVAEVKQVYFANRRGFWATMMTFLMVGAVFTATFVYIRATSLLGFSSRKAAASAARRAAARAAKKGGGGGRGGGGVETAEAAKAEGTEGAAAAAATEEEAAAAETTIEASEAFSEPEAAVAAAAIDADADAAAALDHAEL